MHTIAACNSPDTARPINPAQEWYPSDGYCAGLLQDTVSAALASLQTALRLLAKRWMVLNEELRELDITLARLTKKAAPRLLSRFGVGPQTAATLLITAGDNLTRLHSEAALVRIPAIVTADSGRS